jgi:Phage baseplate assembly protein W
VIGMDQNTGAALSGVDHIRQSIARILSTPLGTRVMRRDFGSRLPDLTDAPMNKATAVLLYAATATALLRWEPRIRLERVQLGTLDGMQGRFVITIVATVIESGAALEASVPPAGVAA